jgi:HD-like signal output (HDOD) protein
MFAAIDRRHFDEINWMKTVHHMPADGPEKLLELLWSRVRQRGDLPGFSKVVSAILSAMRGDDDHEFNMTKTVLSDPALTQRVLRLANSAMYSMFGQSINTVSKAVILLGTESIGHLALGLKLIDGLAAASPDSNNSRNEMEKAVLAGHIARQVASTAGTRDAEEVVVCSMLHSLGRMMVSFYLPEYFAQMQVRCVESKLGEAEAASAVLGMGLDEIGRLIAQQWGFPAGLVDSLQDVSPRPPGEQLDHADWLAALATMSTRCASVIREEGGATDGAALSTLAGDYADMLGVDVSSMLVAVRSGAQTAEEESVFMMRPAKAAEAGRKAVQQPGKPTDAAAILARGVTDMRDAAPGTSTGQLMTMGLETVYQGLGFSRAIVFLHSYERAKYVARMYFGEGTQDLLPRLIFDDAYQPDVFHAALANDKMIFVENAQDPAFLGKLPGWWRDSLSTARSFMVLPLTINRRPIGFVYGDWDQLLPPSKIDPAEVVHLNELRVLVVRAVERRRQIDPRSTRTVL